MLFEQRRGCLLVLFVDLFEVRMGAFISLELGLCVIQLSLQRLCFLDERFMLFIFQHILRELLL